MSDFIDIFDHLFAQSLLGRLTSAHSPAALVPLLNINLQLVP